MSSSDASKVVLTLADSTKLKETAKFGDADSSVDVIVRSGATTSTSAGETILDGTKTVSDAISATIDSVKGLANGNLQVTFNEALDTTVPAADAAQDFVIRNADGKLLTPVTDYTVSSISAGIVTIDFTATQQGVAEVSIPNPRYVKDAIGNVVASSSAIR